MDTIVGFVEAFDLPTHLLIAACKCRTIAGIGKAEGVFMIGGRGIASSRQIGSIPRSSRWASMNAISISRGAKGIRAHSAMTKFSDALRRISLARRSSFTSRSRSLSLPLSSPACAAGTVRRPASSRYHRRSVSAVQPISSAIQVIASHSEL